MTLTVPFANAVARARSHSSGDEPPVVTREANAVVKWTREDGGADAPPGFGAAFTAITPEAKQLVLRYVRNREPILYDDF